MGYWLWVMGLGAFFPSQGKSRVAGMGFRASIVPEPLRPYGTLPLQGEEGPDQQPITSHEPPTTNYACPVFAFVAVVSACCATGVETTVQRGEESVYALPFRTDSIVEFSIVFTMSGLSQILKYP